MPSPNTRLGSTHDRAYAGCIITFVHPDGRELVRHYGGYSYETVTGGRSQHQTRTTHLYGIDKIIINVCAQLKASGGEWKIRTISNPQTIYQDVKGRNSPRGSGKAPPTLPEPQILGRLHLLEHWAGQLSDNPHARSAKNRRLRKRGLPPA